ncbi:MAG: asparagine synthase (glutamine-hydrolyzing) [Bacteroidales bacterium]|nr:asparagine synthase (glutamine-hydrolyzing) [Bacteroidales bacterium]
MCGIFSAINLKSSFSTNDYDIFKKSTNIIDYRGPDACGLLTINSENKQFDSENYNIFLGHRRLSIIDLSVEGNQPMIDNDYIIIFNGEIFNYVELRTQLQSEGIIFKTKTDTEVILKIYQKYGSKGFYKFNGMWAFIIIDLKEQKIIVSRDRFSIKPLYFYENENQIYFASEIKQLLPFLNQKSINNDVFYKYLQQSVLDYNNETFFKDILKVKPKTNLIINLKNGLINEEQYWDYENVDFDIKNVFEQFKELFTDSINIRLRSDVNLGALLSGGLDSSAISLIANELSNNNLRTFSVVSNDRKASEEHFINILSVEKNIKNEKLIFTNDDVLKNIDKVIFHQDEPFGGFSVIAQYLIFERIKKQTDITVVLCGQGGDEIMLGYLKFFFFYLDQLKKQGKYYRMSKEILLSIFYRTVIWQFKLSSAKRYIPSLVNKKDSYITLNGELENTWQCDSMRDRQILDIDKYSVPILAHFEDRNSTANSLESRLPFLDHRLVNLLLSIDTELKIKNGWTKYILRKSINELPVEIRWRRDKKGFSVPEDKWLRKDLKHDILDIFSKSTLDELGIIDKKKFLNYYDLFLKGSNKISCDDISKVFIAEKWARKHFEV